ncbi:hypothetical protein Vadar_007779 [Vaccinium darrowii]|uniref:Uncharacterized protein n=1 Tax=Vaccinium darrowii TaxID=229202 RepID=A0ACB7YU46_9ERIC|nr:hypothetical protein Vadar_007779 [Vaccinium darrowii]
MGDPYGKVKGGRLTFKGGAVASLSKSIDKRKKKNKKNKDKDPQNFLDEASEFQPEENDDPSSVAAAAGEGSVGGEIYTIDAAKRMKYDQLFPVEAKKFAYDPKKKEVHCLRIPSIIQPFPRNNRPSLQGFLDLSALSCPLCLSSVFKGFTKTCAMNLLVVL